MKSIYWIWLSTISHIGPVLQKKLLYHFGSPEAVYYAKENDIRKLKGISKRAVDSIFQNHSLEKAKSIKNNSEKKNIRILTLDDQNYATIAKPCPESPIVLYYKGTIKQANHSIGIIGSRKCSPYGKQIATQIAADCARQHISILSGLAKGIDSYVHSSALKNKGYTIAFLAQGVDLCYPKEHRTLYEEIINSGAVISQYPPGTKAYPKNFLQRNALLSAWSNQLIIVEAGEKSGALTTAQFAKKHNREIFAVPNRIDVPDSKGSNLLLNSMAKPYLDMKSLNLQIPPINTTITTRKRDKPNKINSTEQLLLKKLETGPTLITEVSQLLGLPKIELEELLFAMELKGRVKVLGEMVALKNKKC